MINKFEFISMENDRKRAFIVENLIKKSVELIELEIDANLKNGILKTRISFWIPEDIFQEVEKRITNLYIPHLSNEYGKMPGNARGPSAITGWLSIHISKQVYDRRSSDYRTQIYQNTHAEVTIE